MIADRNTYSFLCPDKGEIQTEYRVELKRKDTKQTLTGTMKRAGRFVPQAELP